MTTPTGAIKFSDIQSEFGTPPGKNLGAYRINQSIGGRFWSLDTGVPTSGPIRFSDLRGKTCNVVVDYSGSDINSEGSTSSLVGAVISHSFNDDTNQNISGPSSDNSAVTVTAENLGDQEPGEGEAAVNVIFTVSRDGDFNTITLTPISGSYPQIVFSKASDGGSESQTKEIIPGMIYRVSVDSGIKLRINNDSNVIVGETLNLEDADDDDYNDLIVQSPVGSFFYKGYISPTESRYYFYRPGPRNKDASTRKRYLITFNDGTVVSEGASNIEIYPNTVGVNINFPPYSSGDPGTYSASGVLAQIYVSKKEKVSGNSLRVWFFSEYDPRNPEGFIPSNSFAQSFSLNWYTTGTISGLSDARGSYNTSGSVVGGFRALPGVNQTKKVYHLIRRKIGNGFSSGNWESTTTSLNFIITSTGQILGAGGRGGRGAAIDQNAPAAGAPEGPTKGGDALTISYPSNIIVENGGKIYGGGGGASGGGYGYVGGPDTRSAGGGGGGGQGRPGGAGGEGGPLPGPSKWGGRNSTGAPGSPGSESSPGSGGVGGGPGHWLPKTGGTGGSWGQPGGAGQPGQGTGATAFVPGAQAGAAIHHPGVAINLSNSGDIKGSTD